MTASVPVYASCNGGLVLNVNKFDLLNSPGVATRLLNFEIALEGGYRRINGFTKFGEESAVKPNGTTPVLGVFPYGLGAVVCSDEDVFYTEDGITWIQINKDTGAGSTEAALAGDTVLPRVGQGKAYFAHATGLTGSATNPYGVLYIATVNNEMASFEIDGTGAGRLFIYDEITSPALVGLLETHSDHLCVVDTVNTPNQVDYSAILDYSDFAGTGSGSVVVDNRIVGLKSFRDNLFIFTDNSIHRLVNINDPSTTKVIPVTNNLGCIDGRTIQEIGGDLIFLGPDGLRTVAGTDRLSDVELGSVSRAIQPLMRSIIINDEYTDFHSVVIRNKNQYRLFYKNSNDEGYGIIGTLRVNPEGGLGYQWSTTRGIEVSAITSHFLDSDNIEKIYHGDIDGSVFIHDDGDSFDGSNISAEFQSPDTHFGDLGLRKTLHYFNASIVSEGQTLVHAQVSFDFGSNLVAQPAPFTIASNPGSSLYGVARYGTARYGSLLTPLYRIALQGSGHSTAFRFFSDDTNPPYTIHGYHIEVMPSGRK